MKSPSEILGTHILQTKVPPTEKFLLLTDDSREVAPQTLFFAIKGTRRDGADFIPKALEHAGTAVVVDDPLLFDRFPRTILVPNARAALAEGAAAWWGHPSKAFQLVGITGTNGKTTCTFLLKQLWDRLEIASGLIGTVETRIGEKVLPSELTTPGARETQHIFAQMAQAGLKQVALEVSSIALDQCRVGGSTFHTVAFTNLTADHLDYHHDFESYFAAKRRLFAEYPYSRAVLNWDDPYGKRLFAELEAPRCLRFSLHDPACEFAVLHSEFSEEGIRAEIATPQGTHAFHSPLVGQHNLANLLTVFAIAYSLELDLTGVTAHLAHCAGAPGRLERALPRGEGPHVFVDYAHSPDALSNVLSSLRMLRGKKNHRILCVFGCGGDRDRTKRPQMARVVSEMSDVAIATSDNPRTEDPEQILDEVERGIQKGRAQYHRDSDRRAAIHLALSLAGPEDVVLIAGKGHETYQILGHTKVPFDDRAVVREYYNSPSH